MKKSENFAKFKMLSLCDIIISVSNIFMQKFNVSILCIQSIRMFRKKHMEGIEFLIQALTKRYVELERAVTLKTLNPCP